MLKFNGDRMFADKKFRIVAKRYSQVQGIDFKEIYATTMYLEPLWLLLGIVALLLGLYL